MPNSRASGPVEVTESTSRVRTRAFCQAIKSSNFSIFRIPEFPFAPSHCRSLALTALQQPSRPPHLPRVEENCIPPPLGRVCQRHRTLPPANRSRRCRPSIDHATPHRCTQIHRAGQVAEREIIPRSRPSVRLARSGSIASRTVSQHPRSLRWVRVLSRSTARREVAIGQRQTPSSQNAASARMRRRVWQGWGG